MLDDLNLQPGEIFTSGRAVRWFAMHRPGELSEGIAARLVLASTNDTERIRYSPTEEDDLLFALGDRQFRLYQPGHDPEPIRAPVLNAVLTSLAAEEAAEGQTAEWPMGEPGSSEFQLENHLQHYLANNLASIEPGLRLFEDEDGNGFEYPAGDGRRIDILAVDRAGRLVVLELKVSKGHEKVVGQILRYMSWIQENKAAEGQEVRGIIVCRAVSNDLRLACRRLHNVRLLEYSLSVTVASPSKNEC